MCCRNRCRCRDREEVAGIQEIALRGPGCISGTGRCEGVLGTGGRCRCEEVLGIICDQVLGDRGRVCCGNVLGTGGREFRCGNADVMGIGSRNFHCSNRRVMGAGQEQRCGQVLGSGGGFQCNDVAGAGRRRCRCKPSCWDLKTPTTVPR